LSMNINSKILSQKFEYFAPKTLEEALNLLNQFRDTNIKVLAGGTDLLVKMKTDENIKVDYLVNIKSIPELNFIDTQEGLKIGATTPLSMIEREEKIITEYSALSEGIKSMAAIAIRNMGTMVGNICNASPAGDTIPPLMAFNASVKLANKEGTRSVLVEDFIIGTGETILKPDELVVQVNIPKINVNSGSAFSKKSRISADIAKINLAVWLEREGKICTDCRIVFGSVFFKTIRAKKAEELLRGQEVNPDLIIKVAKKTSEEIRPIDDIRSTAEYRNALARVMAEDTLKLAWKRAGGEL